MNELEWKEAVLKDWKMLAGRYYEALTRIANLREQFDHLDARALATEAQQIARDALSGRTKPR